jgi:hypothetical protein
MKNPPAIRRGVRASVDVQRLPYISRRRVRAADIVTSVPAIVAIVNAGTTRYATWKLLNCHGSLWSR